MDPHSKECASAIGGDPGSIPVLGRSLEKGIATYPVFLLEDLRRGGAWWGYNGSQRDRSN